MIWNLWEISAILVGNRDRPETNLMNNTLSSLLNSLRVCQSHWTSWCVLSTSRYLGNRPKKHNMTTQLLSGNNLVMYTNAAPDLKKLALSYNCLPALLMPVWQEILSPQRFCPPNFFWNHPFWIKLFQPVSSSHMGTESRGTAIPRIPALSYK